MIGISDGLTYAGRYSLLHVDEEVPRGDMTVRIDESCYTVTANAK